MSETFLGAEPLVAETGAAADESAAVAETDATIEADLDADPAVPAGTVAIGLVRVEPDGSAVIAGTATPSGEVQLFVDEEMIGSETAEASGDFAFITDAPLPVGGVELRIFDVETEQFASTSVIVVVQDDRSSEPLVIASEPGQASEILQGLEGDADIAEAQDEAPLTVADAVTEETSAAEDAAEDTVADAASEPTEVVAETETAEPVAAAQSGEDGVMETAEIAEPLDAASREIGAPLVEDSPMDGDAETTVAADAPDAPVAPLEAVDEAPVDVALADEPSSVEEAAEPEVLEIAQADSPPADEPVTDAGENQPVAAGANVTSPEAATETTAEPEAVAEPEAAAEPLVAIAPPSIDAVEIDGDRNFFAGAGTDGYAVRLYVENRIVGTTNVRDGRWLIEAVNVLTQAAQRVRIDMLDQAGAVVGRAEVNFILELPEDETIVVAEEPGVSPALEIATPANDEPVTETPETAPAAVEAVAPQDSETEMPVADAPAVLDTPVVDTPVADEPVVAEEQPTPVEEPAAQAAPETAPEPEVTEVAVEEQPVPTMVGVTEGSRTTSGRVIIRQGDNLWTIARRVYGEGIRYTQIFEANTAQIRDPDLIYPGQVFDLPGTDVVIGSDDAS